MRQAVSRTRESFAESIGQVIALTREVDESTLQSLEPLLLAADVGSATAEIVLENLRQRALRVGIEGGGELKILLKKELQGVLDKVVKPIAHPASGPEVIMMVGVNGTGKTTTSGKLAAHFTAQHRTVLLCAADTFRAAAIEQLEVWATRSGVQIIKTKQGGDPSAALYDACTASKGAQHAGPHRRHRRPPAHQDRPDERARQDAPDGRKADPRRARTRRCSSWTRPPARTA